MLRISNAQRERLLAKLEDMTPIELFDICGVETQNELRAAFTATLDAADVEELLFAIVSWRTRTMSDLYFRHALHWKDFLERRCLLLGSHGEEIERNYLELFGDDEEEGAE